MVGDAKLSKVTSIAPKEVLSSAATYFIAKGGWEIAYQTDDTLVLRNRSGASVPMGCLLLLLGIIPGLLYFLLAKGTESTLTIQASPQDSGATVAAKWAGREWWSAANQFLTGLPEAPAPAGEQT